MLKITYVTFQKKKKIKLTYFIQLLEDFDWEVHEQRIDVLPE